MLIYSYYSQSLAKLCLNLQATVQFHTRDACVNTFVSLRSQNPAHVRVEGARNEPLVKAAEAINPKELQVSQVVPRTCGQRTEKNRIQRILTNRAQFSHSCTCDRVDGLSSL